MVNDRWFPLQRTHRLPPNVSARPVDDQAAEVAIPSRPSRFPCRAVRGTSPLLSVHVTVELSVLTTLPTRLDLDGDGLIVVPAIVLLGVLEGTWFAQRAR